MTTSLIERVEGAHPDWLTMTDDQLLVLHRMCDELSYPIRDMAQDVSIDYRLVVSEAREMGNHSIGAAMAAVAATMADRRRDGETALEILDAAADASGVRGMDAEFDDAREPGQPLGDLIFEAFAPNGLADRERYNELNEASFDDDAAMEAFDALYDATYGAFSKRYKLC